MTQSILILLNALLLNYCTKPDCLELLISNKVIVLEENNRDIEILGSANNGTADNLILYDFNGVIYMIQEGEDFFCDGEGAAGFELFIYDEKSEQVIPDVYVPDSLDYTQIPTERFNSLMEQSRAKFISNTEVIKANQQIRFKKKVNLKNYHLEKGAYSLQVIYFAGKSISNMVDPRQILEDEEAYDAKIYQGCARSNKVALIVK